MAKNAFEKFSNKVVKGAKKKEAIRQEKRKVKAQLRAEGEEFRRKKLEKLRGITGGGEDRRPGTGDRRQESGDRRKNFGERRDQGGDRRQETGDRRKNVGDRRNQGGDRRGNVGDRKPGTGDRRDNTEPRNTGFKKPGTFNKDNTGNRRNTGDSNFKPTGKPAARDSDYKKEGAYKTFRKNETRSADKPFTPRTQRNDAAPKRSFTKTEGPRYKQGKPVQKTYEQITQKQITGNEADLMPLNKFVAHAGICGRREAAELVKEGKIQVNGSIVYEPGYKVSPDDKVLVKGKQVHLQKNLVYILLNKPKDYITTAEDPQGRKTVLDLIKDASQDRVYPVGRLDRNTTGVLLLTNDGELAQKLTHPSYEIKKLYEVTLDRPLVKKDAEQIMTGVTLEDGPIKANALGYADMKDKSVIGIEIHSGRNRIVRRIFEHFGYKVKNLDRVMFANLTKKNVERGKWRFLNEKEVRLLKYMNQSFVKKPVKAVTE